MIVCHKAVCVKMSPQGSDDTTMCFTSTKIMTDPQPSGSQCYNDHFNHLSSVTQTGKEKEISPRPLLEHLKKQIQMIKKTRQVNCSL